MPRRGERAPPLTREEPGSQCGGSEPRNETRQARHARKKRQDAAFRLWEAARDRAKRTGVTFTISIDDVRAVWPADSRCPVLGLPLQHGIGKMHDASPTLDRLQPQWGYEPGNIAVISLRANRAKGGLTAAELAKVAEWMRAQGLA